MPNQHCQRNLCMWQTDRQTHGHVMYYKCWFIRTCTQAGKQTAMLNAPQYAAVAKYMGTSCSWWFLWSCGETKKNKKVLAHKTAIVSYQLILLLFKFHLDYCNFFWRSLDDNFVLIVIKFNMNLNTSQQKYMYNQYNNSTNKQTSLRKKLQYFLLY